MTQSPVILVTGANRGLGFEISRQLARRGATVILTARSAAAAQSAAERLAAEGLTATSLELDVLDTHSRDALAAELSRRFGRLDVLVNNAGINLDGASLPSTVTVEVVRQTFETNALAPLAIVQSLLPLLRKSKKPRIISISSSMAATGNTMTAYPAYRIAKAALNSATIQLAAELSEQGIAVNAACPGWVRTDLGGPNAPLSVEAGADTPVWLALDAPQDLTGKFHNSRTVIPW